MELKLPLDADCMTVRELIATRVKTETAQHNAELDRGRQVRGLITASSPGTGDHTNNASDDQLIVNVFIYPTRGALQ